MNEQKKALIQFDTGVSNSGEVKNIIICDDRGAQGLRLLADQGLWDCTLYQVLIGDTWADGAFYRDGIPVEARTTPEEELEQLNLRVEQNENALLAVMDVMATQN